MLITIDFETYYDKKFSLSKLTTEEYIRDDRFEVIGVALKVNEEDSQWFSGTKQETKDWLSQFNWGNALVLAHNTMFDGAILSWYFNIHPYKLADTLCMARAVNGVFESVSLANLSKKYNLGSDKRIVRPPISGDASEVPTPNCRVIHSDLLQWLTNGSALHV